MILINLQKAVCPITSNTKKFPVHYEIKNSKKVKGSVLCEHIRSIDFEERRIKYIETIDEEDYKNVCELLLMCIEDNSSK